MPHEQTTDELLRQVCSKLEVYLKECAEREATEKNNLEYEMGSNNMNNNGALGLGMLVGFEVLVKTETSDWTQALLKKNLLQFEDGSSLVMRGIQNVKIAETGTENSSILLFDIPKPGSKDLSYATMEIFPKKGQLPSVERWVFHIIESSPGILLLRKKRSLFKTNWKPVWIEITPTIISFFRMEETQSYLQINSIGVTAFVDRSDGKTVLRIRGISIKDGTVSELTCKGEMEDLVAAEQRIIAVAKPLPNESELSSDNESVKASGIFHMSIKNRKASLK